MVVGRVVRHPAGGLAIRFITPRDRDTVQNLVSAPMNRLTRMARQAVFSRRGLTGRDATPGTLPLPISLVWPERYGQNSRGELGKALSIGYLAAFSGRCPRPLLLSE